MQDDMMMINMLDLIIKIDSLYMILIYVNEVVNCVISCSSSKYKKSYLSKPSLTHSAV